MLFKSKNQNFIKKNDLKCSLKNIFGNWIEKIDFKIG